MGIRSTMEITREDAIKEIIQNLNTLTSEQLTTLFNRLLNTQLEETLEEFTQWHNFIIVENYSSDWAIKYRRSSNGLA